MYMQLFASLARYKMFSLSKDTESDSEDEDSSDEDSNDDSEDDEEKGRDGFKHQK